MKKSVSMKIAAGLTCGMGLLGAGLRYLYFQSALEEGGFLTPMHPLQILFWILAVGMVLLGIVSAFRLPAGRGKAPLDLRTGIVQILLGLSLGLTVPEFSPDQRFYGILRILGWAAAAVLAADGVMRLGKKSLGILPHSLFCVFLLLFSISSYSGWSNVPEMERILVPALGEILMMPLACEMAFWDLGKSSEKKIFLLSVVTGFFCFASLGSGLELLLLGAGIWAVNSLVSLGKEGEM